MISICSIVCMTYCIVCCSGLLAQRRQTQCGYDRLSGAMMTDHAGGRIGRYTDRNNSSIMSSVHFIRLSSLSAVCGANVYTADVVNTRASIHFLCSLSLSLWLALSVHYALVLFSIVSANSSSSLVSHMYCVTYTWDAVTSVNLNISMVRYLRRHLVCTADCLHEQQ